MAQRAVLKAPARLNPKEGEVLLPHGSEAGRAAASVDSTENDLNLVLVPARSWHEPEVDAGTNTLGWN